MTALLRVEHLTRRFGGLVAVNDVSFEAAAGEILGIMGANGAGKTTLFALIGGNVSPSGGRITLGGRRIDGLSPDRVNRLGVARTFQIVRPFGTLSVLENVATAAMYGGQPAAGRAAAEARAAALLEEVGLAPRAGMLARDLTLSDRKRLEVARAMATAPKVLLLDEVLAGLTATEVAAALEMIRALRDAHGLTILVIEHVMRALMRLSDRIVVLHHGRKITEGPPEQVAADPAVVQAYLGSRADG